MNRVTIGVLVAVAAASAIASSGLPGRDGVATAEPARPAKPLPGRAEPSADGALLRLHGR
ncbi:MAG: hypothetical protein QM690_19185 [Sphingobium sp.]